MRDGLDIFRTLPGGGMFWIARVSDLEAAKEHIKPAAVKAQESASYFVKPLRRLLQQSPLPKRREQHETGARKVRHASRDR
jgi:hypothetical protein